MCRILTFCLLIVSFFTPAAEAQLTADQKIADFREIAAVVSKHYAFVEWKRKAISFDALSISLWLDRIQKTTDDLGFWEVCAQYVASFDDSHSIFILPSDYFATLGIDVDIYEGKVYVDSLDSSVFPSRSAPIKIGDEIVAVDGKPVADLINAVAAQVGDGNPRSAQRFAASLAVNRQQALVPRAHEIGDTASLLIHREDGSTDTVILLWNVSEIG